MGRERVLLILSCHSDCSHNCFPTISYKNNLTILPRCTIFYWLHCPCSRFRNNLAKERLDHGDLPIAVRKCPPIRRFSFLGTHKKMEPKEAACRVLVDKTRNPVPAWQPLHRKQTQIDCIPDYHKIPKHQTCILNCLVGPWAVQAESIPSAHLLFFSIVSDILVTLSFSAKETLWLC